MMDMEMTSDLQQEQQMAVRISPRLIAANHILELSSMELQEVMKQEVDETPALEVTEYVNCPRCGALMVDNTCHNCARGQNTAGPDPATFDLSEAYLDTGTWHATSTRNREEEFDPLSLVAAQMSLSERLLTDLAPQLTSRVQERIAEYLIGNLDDNGFLHCSVSEVASVLDVAPAEVEEVLARLQTLEPIGIGARTLQECLLIQLQYLESQGYGNPTAYAIVHDHFEELGAHKYGRIAHALGLGQEDVIAVAHYIREKLNPFPAQQYGSRPRSAPAEIPRYVLPDMVIRQGEEGLEVDVVESRRFVLRISPSYQDMWREVEGRPAEFSERDREHIR